MSSLPSVVLSLLGIYLALGFVCGLLFVIFGVKTIDPAAASGTWGFKVMILPGCVVFWPYLLKRWLQKSPPPVERSNHRQR